MQTKVRVFFDQHEVKGFVIPEDDAELDAFHTSLIDEPHSYLDLTQEEYESCKTDNVPDIYKMHRYIVGVP